MAVPTHLSYTAEHEWLDLGDGSATVGVTAFAADALGDVVHVELPEVGATVSAGEACGELESTKSVSDLYPPVDGVVVEVNAAVVDDPALLNLEPYDRGWLFRMTLTGKPDLLDAAAYDALIGG
jgi:glycine cleavage system H protein